MSTTFNTKPNTYYIIKDIEKDVTVRGKYPDAYDGKNPTGDISNDHSYRIYLAQSTAPSVPELANDEAELNSLSLQYYTNTVSSSTGILQPRIKLYKARANFPINEGTLNVIGHPTAFCSYLDYSSSWMEDNFGGRNVGFADRDDYSKDVITPTERWDNIQYKITRKQLNAALGHKGYYHWKKGGKLRDGPSHYLLGDGGYIYQRAAGGTQSSKFGPVDVVNDSGELIGLQTDSNDAWATQSKYKLSEANLVNEGAVLYSSNEASQQISQTYDVYNYEFTNRINQFNSIFNYVRESPDVEDIKVQTVGTAGDDDKFYTYSRFVLESEDKLSGGGAGQMLNFWENYSGTNTNYAKFFGTTESGSVRPQSIMACIDYFPAPVPLDIMGPRKNTLGGTGKPKAYSDGMSLAAQEIQFTLKVSKQPPLQLVSGNVGVDPGESGGGMHLNRGFYIIFSSIVPNKSDNIHSFIGKLVKQSATATGVGIFQERVGDSSQDYNSDYVRMVPFLDTLWPRSTGPNGMGQIPIVSSSSDPDYPYLYKRNFVDQGPTGKWWDWSMKIPQNEWFDLHFKMPQLSESTDHTLDGKTDAVIEVYTPNVQNDNGTMLNGSLHLNAFPCVKGGILDLQSISIWACNMRANKTSNSWGTGNLMPGVMADEDGFNTDDMEQSILIDSIRFKNFNNEIDNATICDNGGGTSSGFSIKNRLTVPNYSGSNADGAMDTLNSNGNKNYFGSAVAPTQTNFCFGFENKPSLVSGSGISILFNNFGAANLGGFVPPVSNIYISGSYSVKKNAQWGNALGLSAQRTVTAQNGSASGSFNTKDGTLAVDNFIQKGFIGISGAFHDATKRENMYCAARVMGASPDGKEIYVDNPEVFDLPLGPAAQGGTDYVMWIVDDPTTSNASGTAGAAHYPRIVNDQYAMNSNYSISVGMQKSLHQTSIRDGNVIQLNRSTTVSDVSGTSMTAVDPRAGAGLTNPGTSYGMNLNRMASCFISPKKYWFNLHIVPLSGTTEWGEWYSPPVSSSIPFEEIGSRSYATVLLVSGTTSGNTAQQTTGSTYNEFLISDGYDQNVWSLEEDNNGLFEANVDYGYGTYEAPSEGTLEKRGGYINEQFSQVNAYNYMNLDKYVTQTSPDFESSMNFGLCAFEEDSTTNNYYNINIDTREGTNIPKLIWGVADDTPEIYGLTVNPAVNVLEMENPLDTSNTNFSNVKFKWSESADDMWYRLLIIDTATITTKYHKANFIAPLNDSGTTAYYYTGTNAAKKFITKTSATTMSGTNIPTIEGFMGYGYEASGQSAQLSGSGYGHTLGSTSEFTFITHLIPENAGQVFTTARMADKTGGTGGNPNGMNASFRIDGDGKFNVFFSSGSFGLLDGDNVTLTGTTASAFDGTPMAVALTFNNAVDGNNLKLYVNGTLEDTASESTDGVLLSGASWSGGGTDSAFAIGCRWPSGLGFYGHIEETLWHTKELYPIGNPDKSEFNTTYLTDLEGSPNVQSKTHNARLFGFDYHNIRGSSFKEVARTNMCTWKVTGI